MRHREYTSANEEPHKVLRHPYRSMRPVTHSFITSYHKDESLAELKHQAPNYISNSSCHTITLLHSVNTPQYTIYSLQSLVPFCIGGSLGANIFSGAVQRPSYSVLMPTTLISRDRYPDGRLQSAEQEHRQMYRKGPLSAGTLPPMHNGVGACRGAEVVCADTYVRGFDSRQQCFFVRGMSEGPCELRTS